MTGDEAVAGHEPFRFLPRRDWTKTWRSWLPTWSTAAAVRAIRATIVVPGLFAFTYVVIGDLQMATFTAFGGFATLVLAAFAGTRRDKALAHFGLAVAGSALLVVGTVVSTSTALAVIVTAAVAFTVLFVGMTGPNAASGVTAALLAYVLPAASPGTIEMLPSRLAGWWLASLVGTAAVLLFSPSPPDNRLRATAAAAATALADRPGHHRTGAGQRGGTARMVHDDDLRRRRRRRRSTRRRASGP